MRIRSIKPDFWRSQDISCLKDWNVRFIFIGLWSYVDDNGVGKDRVSLIAADLFADDLERDPRETFARVSEALATLSEAGRIVRYTVDGTDYLEIVNWSKHQRIDKPNKERYPASTCENAVIREGVATHSRDTRDTPAPGTGEQGSRGAEDTTANAVVAPRKRGTRLPDDWMPDQNVIEELRADFPHVDLRYEHSKFVDYWTAKTGKDATKLDWNATFRNWIRRAAEQRQPRTPATTSAVDDKVNGWLDLAGDQTNRHLKAIGE